MHVRGFTRHPSSGVAEAKRGTYAGLIEKIPYLQDLGITAVELLPVFQFDAQDCPPGQRQLLGLRADFLLRAAPGLQLAPGRARAARRVSRHGQGAASGRHRSHSRCRVQPHRRGQRGRADALLPRPGERGLLHPGTGPRPLRQLHRHRQHAQRQPSRRPPHDPGQPPLLGRRDARGRLPLRPRVHPRARRQGPRAAQPAGALGHRIGPACWRARN